MSTKMAVVRGEIYAIEVKKSWKKSAIKRYNVERCSWQTVLSSHEGCRLQPCVVVAGDHLYVCCGRLEDEAVMKADRFDAIVNKWEEIANMQQERRGAFCVAFQGKIFVAGGEQDSKSRLKTCEMYNTSTNECSSRMWQYVVSKGNTLCAAWLMLPYA